MIKRLALLCVSFLLIPSLCFGLTERYANCGLGTGLSDGTSEDNAWKSLQEAFDEVAANERINILASQTCTLAATIDMDTTSGGVITPIIAEGYTSSAGDGGIAVVDADSTAVSCFNFNTQYTILKNIECKNSTDTGIGMSSNSDNSQIINVYINNVAQRCTGQWGGSDNTIIMFSECTSWGSGTARPGHEMGGGSRTMYWRNYVHDGTGHGIECAASGSWAIENIIDTTSDSNFYVDGDLCKILSNTFYNSTGDDNLEGAAGDEGYTFINNIMDTASNYNADGSVAFNWGNNNYTDGTTGALNTTPAYTFGTDRTDGSMSTTTFQSSGLDDLGLPTNYDGASGGSTVVGHFEIGAIPYEETGGAAASVHSSGFAN